MTLSKGSLVLADYSVTVKDTGEFIETTVEEEAKKMGKHDPTRKYEPRLIAVGDGWILPGADEKLGEMSEGEEAELDIPPEKGFGPREPSKVRLIPMRKLGERASELSVDDEIEVDGKIGIVRFIGSGRAQIDFNPRFAGRTLTYKLKMLKVLQEDPEKAKALLHRRLPAEEGKIRFTIREQSLTLHLHSDLYLVEGLQIVKRAISNDIFKYVPSITKVTFTESYESAKEPKQQKNEPEGKPTEPESK
jgi:peptidylprolyl isomerase